MARRFGHFREVKEIKPREGTERHLNDINFDDAKRVGFEDFDIKQKSKTQILSEEILSPENKAMIKQEFFSKNSVVEKEISEYYDETVSDDALRMYLTNKITEIYGEALSEANSNVTSRELVDAYLEYNEFDGVESYQTFVGDIEDIILILRENQKNAWLSNDLSNRLNNEDVEKMLAAYRNLMAQGELVANSYLGRKSKELSVDKKELQAFLRKQEKEKISCKEKTMHYHRTSIENAKKILAYGQFLNRENLKAMGEDISHLRGSSSSNVQFSVDRYNKYGELVSIGYDSKDNLGAAATDVVFVMGPKFIEEETYDNFGMYPTIEKASVAECCIAILAKDAEVQEQIETALDQAEIVVPVLLQEQYDRTRFVSALVELEQNGQAKE